MTVCSQKIPSQLSITEQCVKKISYSFYPSPQEMHVFGGATSSQHWSTVVVTIRQYISVVVQVSFHGQGVPQEYSSTVTSSDV